MGHKSSLPEARRRNNHAGIAAGISRNTPYSLGTGADKDTPRGLNKDFGNPVPQEDARDPYRVNKNAKDCK